MGWGGGGRRESGGRGKEASALLAIQGGGEMGRASLGAVVVLGAGAARHSRGGEEGEEREWVQRRRQLSGSLVGSDPGGSRGTAKRGGALRRGVRQGRCSGIGGAVPQWMG